jgi:MinD-like ATPase involved in chromosome partitioning or flagellar assembly
VRTIGLLNSKGGVGRTTLGLNLAATFAEQSLKVALVDLDLSNPPLGLWFPGGEGTPGWSLRASEVANLSLLEFGGLCPASLESATADAGATFKESAGEADLLVVAFGPSLNRSFWPAVQQTDELVFVANPEPAALLAGLRTARLATYLNPGARQWVWGNRALSTGDKAARALADQLATETGRGVQTLPSVLESRFVARCGRTRQLFAVMAPRRPESKAVRRAAARLLTPVLELQVAATPRVETKEAA